MLRIQGKQLHPNDRKILKVFAKWVLNKFVIPSVQKNSNVTIRFIDPKNLKLKEQQALRKYKAWLEYCGVTKGKRSLIVTIDEAMLNVKRKVKNPVVRLEHAIECLGHELVHVKQYLNNESFDYKDGDVRYRGQRYTDWEEGEAYYDSPWEIEAYGREQGLYSIFKEKFKEDMKG